MPGIAAFDLNEYRAAKRWSNVMNTESHADDAQQKEGKTYNNWNHLLSNIFVPYVGLFGLVYVSLIVTTEDIVEFKPGYGIAAIVLILLGAATVIFRVSTSVRLAEQKGKAVIGYILAFSISIAVAIGLEKTLGGKESYILKALGLE
jgi:hypothetical protein